MRVRQRQNFYREQSGTRGVARPLPRCRHAGGRRYSQGGPQAASLRTADPTAARTISTPVEAEGSAADRRRSPAAQSTSDRAQTVRQRRHSIRYQLRCKTMRDGRDRATPGTAGQPSRNAHRNISGWVTDSSDHPGTACLKEWGRVKRFVRVSRCCVVFAGDVVVCAGARREAPRGQGGAPAAQRGRTTLMPAPKGAGSQSTTSSSVLGDVLRRHVHTISPRS